MRFRRKPKLIDRDTALRACPFRAPVHETQARGDGGLDIIVTFQRPAWHRFWGAADRDVHKTYTLDRYGRDVYEGCDGRRPVTRIVEAFARKHKLSQAEAEISVTAFMKTLIRRQLIRMGIPNKGSGRSK